jgi:hypothetical protein
MDSELSLFASNLFKTVTKRCTVLDNGKPENTKREVKRKDQWQS